MAGIILNGSVIKGLMLNGSSVSAMLNGVKVFPREEPGPDPYNPLGLPPNTVRVRTNDGNAPTKGESTTYETATLVAGTTDVYDVYKSGTDFGFFLYSSTNISEVLGANTTSVTNMRYMFSFCTSLETAQLFDTSSVTSINSMFRGCTLLETIPLFDTSNVTDMMYVFNGCSSLTFLPLFNTSKATNMTYFASNCYKVQTGALAIYQQASTQTNPPTSHTGTFVNCGRDTTTGAAELAQIPSNWK